MGLSEPSPGAVRLAPKIIAVGAELAANAVLPLSAVAFDNGHGFTASLIIGAVAACLGVKNWSQATTAAEAQHQVEQALKNLVRDTGSLQKALSAIALDQPMHELVSRDRAEELTSLFAHGQSINEKHFRTHQELLFHIARFVEKWSDAHAVSIEKLDQLLTGASRIESKLDEARNHAADSFASIHVKLDRIEGNIHVPAPDASGISADEVVRHFSAASQTLLTWKTTVGRGQHITTTVESAIVDHVKRHTASTQVLLGDKGIGKSAICATIAKQLGADGFAVLGLRADQAGVVNAADYVPDLPLALSDAILSIAAVRPILVVLDQLDSVSELTDRRSNRLNALLNLIRAVSGKKNVHIVCASRAFDFSHDARLSSLDAEEVRIEAPDWAEVSPILEAEGRHPEQMGESLRELLRVPWNLNLFLKVGTEVSSHASMQSLIEAVWHKSVIGEGDSSGRRRLIEALARQMSEREELFLPVAIADPYASALTELLREDFLILDPTARAIGFRHQTFYEYALARLFAAGSSSLSSHVLAHQDGLFVRPVMLNGLELLRDTSRKKYHREIIRLLGPEARLHIRQLLIEYICQRNDPDDVETRSILSLASRAEQASIFLYSFASEGWFVRLRDGGHLARAMSSEATANSCLQMLSVAIQRSPESVFDLVQRHWSGRPECDSLVLSIVGNLLDWNEKWVSLVVSCLRRSTGSGIWIAENISDRFPAVAARLIRAQLDREFEEAAVIAASLPTPAGEEDLLVRLARQRRDDPFAALISNGKDDRYHLEGIAEDAPQEFLTEMWEWYLRVIAACAKSAERRCTCYRDDAASSHAYSLSVYPLVEAMHLAADGFAKKDPAGFVMFVQGAAATDLLAAHRVLCQALALASPSEPAAVLSYVVGDPRRLTVGTFIAEFGMSEALIRSLCPYLDPQQIKQIESAIQSLTYYKSEAFEGEKAEDRMWRFKWNRQVRLRLLQAIPPDFLSETMRTLKGVEETLLPSTKAFERELPTMSAVVARMTAEELAKASDAQILSLIEHQASNSNWYDHRRPYRTGDFIEQARAFGKFATEYPSRAVTLIDSLRADREDHVLYVCHGVGGLAASSANPEIVFELTQNLVTRKFLSDDFKEAVAFAACSLAEKHHAIPPDILAVIDEWLKTMETPAWPDDREDEDRPESDSGIIFGRAQVMFSLLHGRGTLARALMTACGSDHTELLRVCTNRATSERHPKALGEMLLRATSLFSQASNAAAGTHLFDTVLMAQPEVFVTVPGSFAVAELTGYFRPEETYRKWLRALRGHSSGHLRQLFGELLLLYHARRGSDWSAAEITDSLRTGNRQVLRGLTFGAAEAFHEPHCREKCTEILLTAARSNDESVLKLLAVALRMKVGEVFSIDRFSRELLDAIQINTSAIKVIGAELLEALVPVAGIHPEVVLRAASTTLETIGADLVGMGHGLRSAASSLTNIAITLHRQESNRAAGLDLFERLIKLGVRETAAALELLDRKPYRRHFMHMVKRRQRKYVERKRRR